MRSEEHGEDQYSWPIIYVYPEAKDDNYKNFPITTSSCSYRKLTKEEKNSLILKAFKTCVRTFANNTCFQKSRKAIFSFEETKKLGLST